MSSKKLTSAATPAAAAASQSTGGKADDNKNDKENLNEGQSDSACVVCFRQFDLYSIGECDHPVCYECSTRMRVLCRQNECPICRTNLAQVIFSEAILPFRQLEINNRSGLYDKKFRICFTTLRAQSAFHKLLDNPCGECDKGPFASFTLLKDHLRKEHELFYCDICTDNLKIFSFERKYYSRQNLGLHRRVGDSDNKSHRGHPICEFCDCRFLDRDELYRHMRREHFYCHFCDADGLNHYYADYDALRSHFRSEHYLCEEGECVHEKFTAVFRSEIDLRAHIASIHGKSLGKLATKQARTLEFEFTLAPRNRAGGGNNSGGGGGGGHSGGSHRDYARYHDIDENEPVSDIVQHPQKVIDAQNEQEFPSLGGASSSAISLRPNVSIRTKSYGPGGLARTKENFPALGGTSTDLPTTETSKNVKGNAVSALFKQSNSQANKPASMVIHVSNRPSTSSGKKAEVNRSSIKEFPSLPGSSSKKTANLLETDFVPPPTIYNMSGAVSSKHKSLVDSYESVSVASESSGKLSLVQKPIEKNPSKKVVNENVPKLNSKNNFPALGNSSSAASIPPPWVTTTTKKAPVESRKTKVAPPPLADLKSMPALPTPKMNLKTAPLPAATTKKDKPVAKTKAAPPAAPAKKESDTKSKKKPHQVHSKLHNNNNNDDDEQEPEFNVVPSATVLNAVSSKHRSLLDSYESVAAPTSNKLNIVAAVTKPTTPTKSTAPEIVPQLNSTNNFPSLSSKSVKYEQNNNVSKNMNFIEIMKNDAAAAAAAAAQNGTNGKTAKQPASPTKPTVAAASSAVELNNNPKNFPNLSKDGRTAVVAAAANGPPPGFSGESAAATLSKPPPGFNSVKLNSVAKPANDFTFTNSLGESYSILPNYHYTPPNNSTRRNQLLVTLFQDTLTEPEAVDQFREISKLFISGAYLALPYYEHCKAALGDKFDTIFPELLVLLPDIAKQQELYLVHSQYMKNEAADEEEAATAGKGNKKSNKKSNNNNVLVAMEVCATCKQVLISQDLPTHLQSHALENHFPILSSNSLSTTASWKK